MLLGVVSDSHGHVTNTLDAVRMLESFSLQGVIHCGDIGSAEIPRLFSAWPAHYVFGNVDQEEAELRSAIEMAGHTCHGRFGELHVAGVRIAFLHSDDTCRFQECLQSGAWDLVCFGHTHRAEQRLVGRTLALNPGAIYRARPHSVAVVDLPSLHITLLEF